MYLSQKSENRLPTSDLSSNYRPIHSKALLYFFIVLSLQVRNVYSNHKRYMINKEEFRNKIILIAGQIFSRYGFKKTTMDEIATGLKMGKSSIYYYFESKEDIFEAVVLHEANVLRNELTTAIKSVDSPIDKMRNYVFVRMKSFEKLSNYYNAIFDKNLDHFDFIETIREKYDREELAILRLIIYHGERKKVFNVVNSEYTAMAIQTTLKGLEVPLFWKKKEVNIENRLNAILDVLFYGIVKNR